MTICERAERCVFFSGRMKDMPGTAAIFQRNYCKKDYSRCARHQIMSAAARTDTSLDDASMGVIGRTMETLLPNQEERARSMIRALTICAGSSHQRQTYAARR